MPDTIVWPPSEASYLGGIPTFPANFIEGGEDFHLPMRGPHVKVGHFQVVGERTASAQVDVEYELPVQAVTESIVNAVAHLD